MKVLVVPEDQHVDQYIVKPVIEALLADLGRTANVSVLPEPTLRGADQALDPTMVRGIVAENTMIDLFILVVDRDCDRKGNAQRASDRELENAPNLLACVAIEEVEVWMLALHLDKEAFREARAHCDPKEAYAEPLLEQLGAQGPGGGRKRAMRALSGKQKSLLSRCPELQELSKRIDAWWTQRAARR